MNAKGVTILRSKFTVSGTIDRLQAFLKKQGATIYARINQQAESETAGQDLPPLEFILFGNPKAGGTLMAANPLIALDLPLKVIAWEDESKKVWIAYNEAAWIEQRYSMVHRAGSPLDLNHLIEEALKS